MDKKSNIRKIFPRLIKAALWGFLMGGETLIFLLLPGISEYVEAFLPTSKEFFFGFIVVIVLFEVAIQLLTGTILKYAFSISRAFISMIYLFIVTSGGIMTITIPPEMVPYEIGLITFTIDFRIILAIFLIFSLISVVKNLFQAINFLSEKAEHPILIPEIP